MTHNEVIDMIKAAGLVAQPVMQRGHVIGVAMGFMIPSNAVSVEFSPRIHLRPNFETGKYSKETVSELIEVVKQKGA